VDNVCVSIDHITVAAATLGDGVAWVEERLGGVRVPVGGAHPVMGTHNHLLRLGDALFLEIIAPDPAVPNPPRRPRWYALDDAEFLHRLRQEGPRLATWVARTTDIAAAVGRSPIPLGAPERVGRGGLEWLITVPSDGALPEGGVMPTLIQWPRDRAHPAAGMPDLGFRLLGLELRHPAPDRLDAALDAIGLDRAGILSIDGRPGPASLRARLAAPSGAIVVLD